MNNNITFIFNKIIVPLFIVQVAVLLIFSILNSSNPNASWIKIYFIASPLILFANITYLLFLVLMTKMKSLNDVKISVLPKEINLITIFTVFAIYMYVGFISIGMSYFIYNHYFKNEAIDFELSNQLVFVLCLPIIPYVVKKFTGILK